MEENRQKEIQMEEHQKSFEVIGLAVIIVLLSQVPVVGIVATISVIIWLRHTKRNYKVIYALCVVCLVIATYHTYLLIDYLIFNVGTPGIEKI